MKKKICANPDCENEVKGRKKYCSYPCAFPAMVRATDEIKRKSGPIYEKWKSRLEASKTKI